MIANKGQLTATQPQARRPGVHDVMPHFRALHLARGHPTMSSEFFPNITILIACYTLISTSAVSLGSHSKNTFASGSQLPKTVDIVGSISCLVKRTGGNFEDD